MKKEDTKEQEVDRESEFLSWALTIAIAIVAALLINRFVLINAEIPSGSMENTIMTGDKLIGFRLSYLFGEPKRGDIIIFKYPDDEKQNYVKRVIGCPGETVTIKNGEIYIDNAANPLKEDYLKGEWTVATGPYTFEVPENAYLVLGDNRNNSLDARYWDNTYVYEDKILGKALFRYWPFNKMKVLK